MLMIIRTNDNNEPQPLVFSLVFFVHFVLLKGIEKLVFRNYLLQKQTYEINQISSNNIVTLCMS